MPRKKVVKVKVPTPDFATMTDEEMIEWAKTYKIKSITVTSPTSLSRNKKPKAKKKVVDNLRRTKDYRSEERRQKSWGDKWNRRERFLMAYNADYRAKKLYRLNFRQFTRNSKKYDSWCNYYNIYYRHHLIDHAQTFKIGEDKFVYGFTVKHLMQFLPFTRPLFDSLIDNEVLPTTAYEGYVFKKHVINDEKEEFYLLAEALALMQIFFLYRRHYIMVKTDEQKAYLKRELWTKFLEVRKDFDQ